MRKIIIILVLLTTASLVTNYSSASLVLPSSSVPAAPTKAPDPSTVKSAINEFKYLSKRERKSRIREAKKEIKAYKAARKAGKVSETETWVLVLLAILLPPLAVYLHQGEINSKFWISIILTLLFWIPGVIFAFLVIFDAV
jgi:uncharacterized membrane protein YqaE (UPF0057 family)